MTKNKRKKPAKPTLRLTPAAESASPSDRCWKCKGTGLKFDKSRQAYHGASCGVCNGEGIRTRSKRAKVLASAPGKILNLRGYPQDHPLRRIFPEGFAGPRAFWGNARNNRDTKDKECKNNDNTQQQQQQQQHAYEELPDNLCPKEGEIVGSLGCGDWRIFQIADGNKLTVDDFVCAWVAAEEMRKRGYGAELHKENPTIGDRGRMFGGSDENLKQRNSTINCNLEKNRFRHADIGTGCGSVLMMTAWAFLGEIQSIGVEAQSISFNCLKRGLEWNLGNDGTSPNDVVQIRQNDLRTWDGFGVKNEKVTQDGNDLSPRHPYHLITGTPPYFPLDSFVASQNHEQKVRCRVPTRGGAPDYIEAASRFLMEENSSKGGETTTSDAKKPCHSKNEGVFCMVEAAFDKAEAGVLEAVKKFNMRVRRRVDVVTRTGLPPRFSCWVMTKKRTDTNAAMEASNIEKADDDKTENTDNNEDNKIGDNDSDTFPIEILTLRNADFTRTKEYTDAMEIMGWVDFEKSKLKIEKTAEETVGANKEEE